MKTVYVESFASFATFCEKFCLQDLTEGRKGRKGFRIAVGTRAMGLDSVELVMEVEESFDIKIPDDAACEMRTVGDLYEHVLQALNVPAIGEGACVTAATFRLLRRTLHEEFGVGSPRLRPSDCLDRVLPKAGRRGLWERWQRSLDLRLPGLAWSKTTTYSIVSLVVVTGAVCGGLAFRSLGPNYSVLAAVLSAMLAGVLYSLAAAPLATHPRPAFATFRGLAQEVSALNYTALTERFEARATRQEVWYALSRIIVNQLGVEPTQVVPEASFVNDLGMS